MKPFRELTSVGLVLGFLLCAGMAQARMVDAEAGGPKQQERAEREWAAERERLDRERPDKAEPRKRENGPRLSQRDKKNLETVAKEAGKAILGNASPMGAAMKLTFGAERISEESETRESREAREKAREKDRDSKRGRERNHSKRERDSDRNSDPQW